MDKRKKDQISVGLSYISLSILFLGLLVIPFLFFPQKITYHSIVYFVTTIGTYKIMYCILFGVLSLFGGISVLLLKSNSSSFHLKMTVVMSGLLVLLDIPFIIWGIQKLIMSGTSYIVVITCTFGLYLALMVVLLKTIRAHLSKHLFYSLIGSSVGGIAVLAFAIGYFIGSKATLAGDISWHIWGVSVIIGGVFCLIAALVTVININQKI